MKKTRLLYFLAAHFLLVLVSHAQSIETIKFKKDRSLYFFQKGAKSDTVAKGQHDVFYLLVPDSMKESILITVENGRFVTTGNDSLVQLEYLGGLQYESLYAKSEVIKNKGSLMERRRPNDKPKAELKTLINGTSAYPAGTMLIRITDKKHETLLIENTFYYRF